MLAVAVALVGTLDDSTELRGERRFDVPHSDAEEFRDRASDCRKAAERATRTEDRDGWLRLAAEWDDLAAAAAERRGIFDRYE